jgi:hypothetical protein
MITAPQHLGAAQSGAILDQIKPDLAAKLTEEPLTQFP